nr:hypothetical protein TetV2_00211 [Oceanusvirus sp.]
MIWNDSTPTSDQAADAQRSSGGQWERFPVACRAPLAELDRLKGQLTQRESYIRLGRNSRDDYKETLEKINKSRNGVIDGLTNAGFTGKDHPKKDLVDIARGYADRVREMAYGLKIAAQSSNLYWNAVDEAKAIVDGTRDPKEDTKMDMPCFLKTRKLTGIELGEKDVSKFNKLLLYIQFCLRNADFRRYDDSVYERVKAPNGNPTIAWKPHSKLSEFIYRRCDKSENPEMWLLVAQPSDVVGAAVRYFVSSCDPEFPALKKDKGMFSFSNGVYLAASNEFFEYPLEAGHPLHGGDVPGKHFDQEFPVVMWRSMGGRDGVGNWRDIPTPAVQTIFEYQDIPQDAIDMMYLTTGRLMHDVGKKDNYGYVGMITGAAGNGKSTFCMHLAKLWDADDVGVLSNNCERKFALWAFSDKFLFIAPEIKADFCLDQAEWQGITTGDPMSIAGKFLKATSIRWTTPGFFCGNQVPDWVDHGGSVLRRIIQWRFDKRVAVENADLSRMMEAELPSFILKSACAYMDGVATNGGGAVWNWAPKYFKDNRRDLMSRINPLQNFIESDRVVKDPAGVVSFDVFKKELKRHCDANGYRAYNFANDSYTTILVDNGLEIKNHRLRLNGGERARKVKCVVGCKLSSDDMEDDDSDDDCNES